MRRAFLLLAMLALAGCGDDAETMTVTATTTVGVSVRLPPRLPFPLPADGTLAVDEFNGYTESIVEHWERDLAAVVGAFAEAGASDAASRSFKSTSRDEGATATLTLDGLLDDSVRAQRYDFELSRRDDGTWKIESASWSQRCQPSRGHQAFSPALCV